MADKKVIKKSSMVKSKTLVKKPIIKKPVEVKPVTQKLVEPVESAIEQKVEGSTRQVKPQSSVDRGALFLGASLLLIGGIWLASHYLRIPLAAYVWPFAIIIPGILLFISAVNMQSGSGEAFSVVGSILTSTGLLLFCPDGYSYLGQLGVRLGIDCPHFHWIRADALWQTQGK